MVINDLIPVKDRIEEYKKRLKLPLEGSDSIKFYTKSRLLIAHGYRRIVIGKRGPYIEFSPRQIIKENIFVPADQMWRMTPGRFVPYYTEWRSNCPCNVKLYFQTRTVDYADYIVGMWYISPFDLTSDKYPVLIEPLHPLLF